MEQQKVRSTERKREPEDEPAIGEGCTPRTEEPIIGFIWTGDYRRDPQ